MVRLLALAGPLLLVPAAPAHVPAKVVIAEPAEGAVVEGDTVRVVLRGEGGMDAAAFRLDLDGRTVDATGRIGGVFSTLTVRPNERLVVEVPVEPGEHTLTATPNADADSVQETAVRRFTVVAGGDVRGFDAVPLAVAAGALAAVAGAAFAVRRRVGRAT